MNAEDLIISTASKDELGEVLNRFPAGHPTYEKAHKEFLSLGGESA